MAYVRTWREISIMLLTVALALSMCGCGGGGGAAGVADAGIQRSSASSQSADFGTYWRIPEPLMDSAAKFTWVSPFPNNGELDQVKRLPSEAGIEVVTPFSSCLVHPDKPRTSGVSYEMAVQRGWIVSDITTKTGYYLCDIAAPGYADDWADGAIERAKEFGAKCVFIDSVDTSLRYFNTPWPKYQQGEEWQKAMLGFLKIVTRRIHQAGMQVAINYANGGHVSWRTAPAGEFFAMADTIMNERFAFWPDSSGRKGSHIHPSYVDMQIYDVQTVQKKAVLVVELAKDDHSYDKKVRYGLAEYLMCRKPGDVMVLVGSISNERTYWHDDLAVAKGLGAADPPIKTGNLWTRRYQQALVLLNTTDATVTVPDHLRLDPSVPASVAARTGIITSLK